MSPIANALRFIHSILSRADAVQFRQPCRLRCASFQKENAMPAGSPRVRQNYLAILVAAIASFLFEAVWYSLFLNAWLKGIGHSRHWLDTTGVSLWLQCGTALLAAALLAATISAFTQLTGAQTAWRGVKIAGALWAGCVLATLATEYVFEVRSYAIFSINTGFWLIAMALMGAIVGSWKKR
jgi:hypothetical protein